MLFRSVELYGHNLGNERGIAEYGNMGAANQHSQAVFIQPRTVGVQVAVKF